MREGKPSCEYFVMKFNVVSQQVIVFGFFVSQKEIKLCHDIVHIIEYEETNRVHQYIHRCTLTRTKWGIQDWNICCFRSIIFIFQIVFLQEFQKWKWLDIKKLFFWSILAICWIYILLKLYLIKAKYLKVYYHQY